VAGGTVPGVAVIDPTVTWRVVEARLAREADPRRRQLLENLLAHMHAEAAGDLDGLLATLAPDPQYHQWGAVPADAGPKGWDAVTRFYTDLIASGATNLEYAVERLVVDDDCIATDGIMRIVYPGRALAAAGRAVDDVDAWYLYETRMGVFYPYDADGRMVGEDTYVATDGFAAMRRLDPDELAPALRAAPSR
jgi:hypothetical protein